MKLSGQTRGFIDPTNAHAWGLLRMPELQWDFDAIAGCGLPRQLLPAIVPSGSSIGHVSEETSRLTGIPQGANVCVSSGDHQASVLGCLSDPEHQIALNLGSGGQCTVAAPREFPIATAQNQFDYEIRPFFNERFLICTAVLAGGIAWRWLADSLRGILRELGMDASESLSDDALFARLNELGTAATESLTVDPRFCGERNARNARGSIAAIDLDNFRIGPLARGLAEGIIANLKRGLPANALINKTTVCLTGNAFRRNPVLRTAAERVFGLPVILSNESEEAATGAAMLALSVS
jgi:sugar (pentulose or hexulose) kinase